MHTSGVRWLSRSQTASLTAQPLRTTLVAAMDIAQLAIISARLASAQHEKHDAHRGRERLRGVVAAGDYAAFSRWASQGVLPDVGINDRVIYYSCNAREYVSTEATMYGGSLVHELAEECGRKGQGGETVLRYAKLLEDLVRQHGCDINAINLLGRTPLHQFVCAFADTKPAVPPSTGGSGGGDGSRGKENTAPRALVEVAKEDADDEGSSTVEATPAERPLSAATGQAAVPRWALLRTLLELGADVEAPDAAGFTPTQLLYKKISSLNGEERGLRKLAESSLAENDVDPRQWADHPYMSSVKQAKARTAEVQQCLQELIRVRQVVQSVRARPQEEAQVPQAGGGGRDSSQQAALGTPLKAVLSTQLGAQPVAAGTAPIQAARSFFQPHSHATYSGTTSGPVRTGQAATVATPAPTPRTKVSLAQYGSPDILQGAVDVSTDSEVSGLSGTPSPSPARAGMNRGVLLAMAGSSPPEWRPLAPISSVSGSMQSLTSKFSDLSVSATDGAEAADAGGVASRSASEQPGTGETSPKRPTIMSAAPTLPTLSTLQTVVPAGTPRRPPAGPTALALLSPAATARATRAVRPQTPLGSQTTLWASVPQAAVEQIRLTEAHEGIRRQQGWAYYAVLLCDRRPPGQESLPSSRQTGYLGRDAVRAGLPAQPNPSSVVSRVDSCLAMSPQVRSEEHSTGRLPPLVEVRRIRPVEGCNETPDALKYGLRMSEDPESGYCVAAAIGPFIDPLPLLESSAASAAPAARAMTAVLAAKECAKWWTYGMQAAFKVRNCVGGCCKEEQTPLSTAQADDNLQSESEIEEVEPSEPVDPGKSGNRYQLKQKVEGSQGAPTSANDHELRTTRCPQRHGTGFCEWSALAWAKALGKLEITTPKDKQGNAANLKVRLWLRPYRHRARWHLKRIVFPALGSLSSADRKDVWSRSLVIVQREYDGAQGRRSDFTKPISLLGSSGSSEGESAAAIDSGEPGQAGTAVPRYLGRGSPARSLVHGVLSQGGQRAHRGSEGVNPEGHRALPGTPLRARLDF